MRNCFHNGSKESSVLRLMRIFPPGKTSEFLESKPAICPRKKYYDKRPLARTVSTASYRSPAFTCRRMRCMWFLTVCSERCKALAISLLVHPLATNETSSCCLRVIVSGLYLTVEFKFFLRNNCCSHWVESPRTACIVRGWTRRATNAGRTARAVAPANAERLGAPPSQL